MAAEAAAGNRRERRGVDHTVAFACIESMFVYVSEVPTFWAMGPFVCACLCPQEHKTMSLAEMAKLHNHMITDHILH